MNNDCVSFLSHSLFQSANGDEDDSEKGDEEEKNGGASPEKVEDNDDSGEEIETPQPVRLF